MSSGQVQSKKCIEEVLHFAYEENLFVMADEVKFCTTLNGKKNFTGNSNCIFFVLIVLNLKLSKWAKRLFFYLQPSELNVTSNLVLLY